MRKDAQPPAGGIYRPRNPRASPLYQCLRRHGDELDAAGLSHRPVETQVLERFIACGDLHHGFARVYCDQCGHDYLLAYSCKTRYFCPSCHQKRMLAYGEWLQQNLLAPVPHRQYVFALPKLIRPFFRYRRRHPGELCRWVAGLLRTGFKAMDPRGQPAFILYVQTFGNLVTFNPHIHALSLANFISFLTFLIVRSDWKENLPLRKVRRIRKAVIDRERARALCAEDSLSRRPFRIKRGRFTCPNDEGSDRPSLDGGLDRATLLSSAQFSTRPDGFRR
jgi:hypothetical protein